MFSYTTENQDDHHRRRPRQDLLEADDSPARERAGVPGVRRRSGPPQHARPDADLLLARVQEVARQPPHRRGPGGHRSPEGEIAQASFAEVNRILDQFNAQDRAAGRPRADLYAAKLLIDGTQFFDRQHQVNAAKARARMERETAIAE
jgi:hypothetical protein